MYFIINKRTNYMYMTAPTSDDLQSVKCSCGTKREQKWKTFLFLFHFHSVDLINFLLLFCNSFLLFFISFHFASIFSFHRCTNKNNQCSVPSSLQDNRSHSLCFFFYYLLIYLNLFLVRPPLYISIEWNTWFKSITFVRCTKSFD